MLLKYGISIRLKRNKLLLKFKKLDGINLYIKKLKIIYYKMFIENGIYYLILIHPNTSIELNGRY